LRGPPGEWNSDLQGLWFVSGFSLRVDLYWHHMVRILLFLFV